MQETTTPTLFYIPSRETLKSIAKYAAVFLLASYLFRMYLIFVLLIVLIHIAHAANTIPLLIQALALMWTFFAVRSEKNDLAFNLMSGTLLLFYVFLFFFVLTSLYKVYLEIFCHYYICDGLNVPIHQPIHDVRLYIFGEPRVTRI